MQRAILTLVAVATLASFASVAKAEPSSGLLLGVYAYENWRGLAVTGTIPGYAAHGRLYRQDVLTRVSDGSNIYSVGTSLDIEYAKDQIGPNRTASLEVYRPGFGYIYLWVEFQPVNGGVHAYSTDGVAAKPQMKAMMKTERERPGAKAFFNGQENGQDNGSGGQNGGFGGGQSNGGSQSGGFGGGKSNSSDPASFFNRP